MGIPLLRNCDMTPCMSVYRDIFWNVSFDLMSKKINISSWSAGCNHERSTGPMVSECWSVLCCNSSHQDIGHHANGMRRKRRKMSTCHVLVIGSKGAGKTCLIHTFCNGEFK